MTEETKEEGAESATGLPAAEQLEENLRFETEILADSPAESTPESPPEPPPESTLDSPMIPAAERAERRRDKELFRMSRSERVVATCTEIYAVAKTALDEVNQGASPYLTFQQKKHIHAQAANFAAEPPHALYSTDFSNSEFRIGSTGQDSISVEEIERRIFQRIQDSLGSELGLLASRAGSTAIDAGQGSNVGSKLEGLAGALRALERSLPERISEVLDSKLTTSPSSNGSSQGLIAAVQEVRSARTGFSIADLDLSAVAALTDRAGLANLPRLTPVNSPEETLPYPAPIPLVIPALDDKGNASLVPESLELEAPLIPAEEPVPQTAVVFLEQPVEDHPELDEDDLDEADKDNIEEEFLESIDLDLADLDEADLDLADLDEADLDGAELDEADLDEADLDEGDPITLAEPTPTSENVVLAPVVTEEDSFELDLGGVTGDVSPPELAVKDSAESDSDEAWVELDLSDDPEQEATVVAAEDAEEATVFQTPAAEEATVVEAPEDVTEAAPSADDSTPPLTSDTEIEIRLQHAAELRSRNKLAESMRQYDEVITITGPNYEAHIGRGVVFLQTRNYERAAAEFTTASGLDNTRPAGSLGLAEVSFHQKHFAQAIEHYSACIRLDPRLAQAFRNRGLCHYHQADYQQSASDLRKAFELDPTLPNIKKYLKIAQNKLRAADEAALTEATP